MLCSHQSKWQLAYDKYLDLSQQYKADEARMQGSSLTKWPSLRLFALSRALECHLNMEYPINRTFTLLGFEYLKVFTDAVGEDQGDDRLERGKSTIAKIVQSWIDYKAESGPSGKHKNWNVLRLASECPFNNIRNGNTRTSSIPDCPRR